MPFAFKLPAGLCAFREPRPFPLIRRNSKPGRYTLALYQAATAPPWGAALNGVLCEFQCHCDLLICISATQKKMRFREFLCSSSSSLFIWPQRGGPISRAKKAKQAKIDFRALGPPSCLVGVSLGRIGHLKVISEVPRGVGRLQPPLGPPCRLPPGCFPCPINRCRERRLPEPPHACCGGWA